nr:immunoglobulin light chain junction region [Macaca mulatta]MOX83234.1 immunoglobulin light chain junction region [Macaca mulatta]MOX84397.1 immunoglobulin light chain junction region [Macaca mulatta]
DYYCSSYVGSNINWVF